MTFPPVASPASAPAALAAFLRGVERRGAVLAELQAGDAAAGDAALAVAMAGFRPMAADLPMSEWPRAFWVRLLADPRLQHRTEVALPLDATDCLAELGSGPRAALLLRLAAGLDETAAAQVLGVALPTYRLALQRALPHHTDGRADPQAWQRLREQVHRRIKTLAPERLQRLAQAREAALLGRAPALAAADLAGPVRKRPRLLLGMLWALLALCAAAFAATFWWPAGGPGAWLGARLDPGPQSVRSRPLPPAQPPASRYGAQAGAVSHRDFALLVDPDGDAIARELDYYSWLAVQQTEGAVDVSATLADPDSAPSPGMPGDGSAAATTSPDAYAETGDAPR